MRRAKLAEGVDLGSSTMRGDAKDNIRALKEAFTA